MRKLMWDNSHFVTITNFFTALPHTVGWGYNRSTFQALRNINDIAVDRETWRDLRRNLTNALLTHLVYVRSPWAILRLIASRCASTSCKAAVDSASAFFVYNCA